MKCIVACCWKLLFSLIMNTLYSWDQHSSSSSSSHGNSNRNVYLLTSFAIPSSDSIHPIFVSVSGADLDPYGDNQINNAKIILFLCIHSFVVYFLRVVCVSMCVQIHRVFSLVEPNLNITSGIYHCKTSHIVMKSISFIFYAVFVVVAMFILPNWL